MTSFPVGKRNRNIEKFLGVVIGMLTIFRITFLLVISPGRLQEPRILCIPVYNYIFQALFEVLALCTHRFEIYI